MQKHGNEEKRTWSKMKWENKKRLDKAGAREGIKEGEKERTKRNRKGDRRSTK